MRGKNRSWRMKKRTGTTRRWEDEKKRKKSGGVINCCLRNLACQSTGDPDRDIGVTFLHRPTFVRESEP